MSYSERTDRLAPSATLAVLGKIQEMIQKGENAISYGAGEPDFLAPEHVREAAIKAIRDGQMESLPTAGLTELKEAIADYYTGKKGLQVDPSQVLISNGSKQTIMNAILTLVEKGDEVLIPVPAWVSYPEQVKLADATPVFVPTSEENGFMLTADMLRPYITRKSKLLILNNPNNPTGSLIDRKELLEIAELMVRHGIYIICDEIYDCLIYDNKRHYSLASLSPEVRELTVTTNGFSKTYAMPGWRVGYGIAKTDVIKRMTGIQSHSTSGGNHIAQRAAVAALRGPQDCVEEMRQAYLARRDYLLERLQRISGLSCPRPNAAFYVFPNVTGLFGRNIDGKEIASSMDLTSLFLEKIKVGVVAGSAFEAEGYIRFSYACDIKKIEEGMDRIEKLLGSKE
ncbi:MAG: pyridoxal phosphate-dependent aminotransferase [Pseudomonadota bacterium]